MCKHGSVHLRNLVTSAIGTKSYRQGPVYARRGHLMLTPGIHQALSYCSCLAPQLGVCGEDAYHSSFPTRAGVLALYHAAGNEVCSTNLGAHFSPSNDLGTAATLSAASCINHCAGPSPSSDIMGGNTVLWLSLEISGATLGGLDSRD